MKRIPALFLAFILLLALPASALADHVTDIIRPEGEPARFPVEYTEDADDPRDRKIDTCRNPVDADGVLIGDRR